MKEAGEFAIHLKRCEKDIRTLKNATEGVVQLYDQPRAPPPPRSSFPSRFECPAPVWAPLDLSNGAAPMQDCS